VLPCPCPVPALAPSSNPKAATACHNQTHSLPFFIHLTTPATPAASLSLSSLARSTPIVALLLPWFAWLCFSSSQPRCLVSLPRRLILIHPLVGDFSVPDNSSLLLTLPCCIGNPDDHLPRLPDINSTDPATVHAAKPCRPNLLCPGWSLRTSISTTSPSPCSSPICRLLAKTESTPYITSSLPATAPHPPLISAYHSENASSPSSHVSEWPLQASRARKRGSHCRLGEH
jgi:hypothetical protein